MKRNVYFNLTIALGIALLLIGGVVIASRVQAQEPDPGLQEVLAPQSAVDTAFTYQGRLIQNGNPISDTCDFEFTLYDDNIFPAQVDGPVTQTNVAVSDGYFATNVDFGGDAFTGEGRQMGIAVRCPAGNGDYTDLSGRVMLHAAPYAHSLRPGAVISSSTAGPGAVLHVEDTYSGMFASAALEGQSTQGTGVRGESSSGYGVYGEATAGSGTTYGVYGSNNSTTDGSYGGYFVGYGGVYGRGTGTFGPGVRGTSTEEAGGYFTSTNDVGVFGRSENSWGVYGYAAGTSGETYGVYGRSDSGTGYGVYGYSSASSHGVHGKADAPDGYGIYSEGNAYVEGELFWDAKTSYVSVSTAAFIPELLNDAGHVEYDNEGYYLKNESSSAEWFMAPVQLPHGATVTELQVGWRDGSDTQATVFLRRRSMTDITSGSETMASVASVGTLGGTQEGVWSDDTIDNAAVNNQNYTYYLEVGMQDSTEDIVLKGVVIEYTITEPY